MRLTLSDARADRTSIEYMVRTVAKELWGAIATARVARVFFEPFGWQRNKLRNFPAIGTLASLRQESGRHGHRCGFHGVSEFKPKIAF
jgi:hypothetical protein